jgi:hypothetical protein
MAAVAVIEKYCVAAPDSGTRQTTNARDLRLLQALR